MSFQRRGGRPTFDDEKYSSCAIRGLEREVGNLQTARSKAAFDEDRASREARRQASEARRAASALDAAAPSGGAPSAESATPAAPRMVGLSGLKVLSFDRATSTLSANFLVIGAGAEKFFCRYSLTCGPAQQTVSSGMLSCIKPRDAVRADGELHFTSSMPAPEGTCSFSLDLTDGSTGSSNRATATIP